MVLITGTVSGSYHAFYLSSFQPVKVLKGKIQEGRHASTPRKVLVTLQFGFSILLIIGTIVIYQQIQLVKGRQLGYEQENLITIDYTEEIKKNYEVLKHTMLQSGVVEAVTISNSAITDINSNNFVGWPGKPEDQRVLFTTINMTSRLSHIFATLTIFITGLGLFGLASYTDEKRTKEIDIRKVLGASVGSIITLMSKDFSRLVLFAFVISAPVAWWLLTRYLERYPIRTDIQWWIFPLTGSIAPIFALIVVTTQAIKAAHNNPVKSLRSE